MTKFCSACHTANKESARYCRGCAGRFSGIRSSAASFDTTEPDRSWEPSAPTLSEKPAPAARPPVVSQIAARRIAGLPVPAGLDASVVWLLIVLVLLQGAFVLWYLNRPANRSAPQSPTAALSAPLPPPAPPMSPAAVIPVPAAAQEGRDLPSASPVAIPPPENEAVPVLRAAMTAPDDSASTAVSPAPARTTGPRGRAGARTAEPAPAYRQPEIENRAPMAISLPPIGVDVEPKPRPLAPVRAAAPPVAGALPPAALPLTTARPITAAAAALGAFVPCDHYNPFGEVVCSNVRRRGQVQAGATGSAAGSTAPASNAGAMAIAKGSGSGADPGGSGAGGVDAGAGGGSAGAGAAGAGAGGGAGGGAGAGGGGPGR